MEFFESFIDSDKTSRMSKLAVRTTGEKSCWVALPPALVNRLIDGAQLPLTLQLTKSAPAGASAPSSRAPVWHVAWQGAASTAGHNAIEVPAQLAALLGIFDGLAVDIQAVADVPASVSATVEPANVDDWEVVEANAEYLTDQMLNQVGVVAVGQPFPFWVRKNTMLTLRVSAAVPADLVRLVHGAEVYVAPRPRQRPVPPVGAVGSGAAANALPAPAPPLPPVWLRIQEAGAEALVPLGGADAASSSGRSEPDGSAEWQGAQTWATTVAWVSPQTAIAQRLRPGDAVLLTSTHKKRRRTQRLRLAISDAAAPGHVVLAPATIVVLQTAPRRHLRLQALETASQPLPRLVSLLPLVLRQPDSHPEAAAPATANGAQASLRSAGTAEQLVSSAMGSAPGAATVVVGADGLLRLPGFDGGGSAGRWLGAPGTAQLLQLFPAWLAAQAEAAGGALDDAVLLQDGTVVALQHPATGAAAHFSVQLQPGVVPGVDGGGMTVLMRNGDVRAAGSEKHANAEGCRIELGAAVPLQAVDAAPSAPPPLRGRPAWLRPAAEAALRRAAPLLAPGSRSSLAAAGAPPPGAGLLVTGAAGAGKTALAAWLADALRRGCGAHGVYLDCAEIAGDAAGAVQKAVSSRLAEAVACMPSLLILDGLEVVCPAAAAGGDPGLVDPGEGALAAWLCDALSALRAPSRPPLPVVVVATCGDAAELAEPLRASGCLDAVVALPAPGPAQREAILAAELASRGVSLPQAELQAAAGRMEGYDAADMAALLDRAQLAAARRRLSLVAPLQAPPPPPPTKRRLRLGSQDAALRGDASLRNQISGLQLEEPDLETARRGFSPSAFWGVGRPADAGAGVKGWEEVGGLGEVKAALREALELPARAPALVACAPLRLRTGALLYGPPGCGKTHAVRAAAAAAGLRLIAVSGPEVLNKYIGASEAAVRDLFRRAAAAAPCVLFFDEFDSIAPQRGHDSTGVTDRVVNQLLTELDGVEGLKGVSVVGATSRPDLLDAALLRPGRLDRLLLCGFPDARERVAIARALASRLRLAPDVELDAMAAGAEGFTGADLRALLTEAQLAAVHETLDAQLAAQPGSPAAAESQAVPVITNAHLRAAFHTARPSVSGKEAARLTAVYKSFRQNRDPGWGGEGAKAGQRTTLA